MKPLKVDITEQEMKYLRSLNDVQMKEFIGAVSFGDWTTAKKLLPKLSTIK